MIAAILRRPVDLFWNGGIGTFVKASDETHTPTSATARTTRSGSTATDLRAASSARAATSGFTQKARIEYAEAGGRINTDAIDNSAGVDCSDHEVNLKILLGIPVANGDLTLKQRNELLREVEQDVAAHVLYDNYLQAQILSQEDAVSADRLEAYEDLMRTLEAEGLLDREIESLPSTEEMAERRRSGRAMARPELCILLAYAKRSLEEAIRQSDAPGRPVSRARRAALLPARGRRPLRRPDRAAPAAAGSRVDDHRERGRQRPGRHLRLAARRGNRRRARRGRARLLDRPRCHRRRRALGGRRGARRQDRSASSRTS